MIAKKDSAAGLIGLNHPGAPVDLAPKKSLMEKTVNFRENNLYAGGFLRPKNPTATCPTAIRAFTSLLFLFLLALPLAAQNVLLDHQYHAKTKTHIRVTALASNLPKTGYVPIRIEVRNDEKSPVTWTINSESSSYNYSYRSSGNTVLNSTQNLTCPVGESRTFDLSIPVVSDFASLSGHSNAVSLTLNISPNGGLPENEVHLSTLHDQNWPSVLISESLYLPKKLDLDKEINPGGSRHGLEFGASFDPKKMSADWHSYLGYQVIMMSEQDWHALAPAAQSAILTALRFGNQLRLYYETTAPTWASLQLPESALSQQNYGTGRIALYFLADESALNPANLISALKKKPSKNDLFYAAANDFTASYSHHSSHPLITLLDEKSFNLALVVIVLIIFGIVVGPVNLFVFAKNGQRHRLFITTPLIALAASFLLFIIIVFQDGFGGDGHRAVLMQVHAGQNENTAYLSQEQITRTGLLFSTSFQSEAGAWMTPAMLPNSRWTRVNRQNFGGGNKYQLQENEGASGFRGNWFQSRSEQAHLLMATRPTRGRIELASAAEGEKPPLIRSTFDFPLDQLFYRDKAGGIWFAEKVSNAAPVTLKKTDEATWVEFLQTNADLFGQSLSRKVHLLGQEKGIFMARAENGPAIESLRSIKWRSSPSVLTGPIYQP